MPAEDKNVESEVLVLDSYKVDDERIVSSTEDIVAIKGKFSDFITNVLKGSGEQIDLHLGMILFACAVRTTSKKAFSTEGILAEYTLSGKKYIVHARDLLNFINSLPQLNARVNKIRVFCRSFANAYLSVCRAYSQQLPKLVRCTKLGIPAQYSYLQADFISDCSELTEHEQAVLVRGRDRALNPVTGAGASSVTNLYELGSRSQQ
ncbi:22 kDa protein [Rehmannia virus 1]|uniref:22 kDa protein n=1 Tax=Rehmannia virus 1 TaxID=2316740 RepID=A0A385HW58_9CLOS|nr:22 kDa protein [Rehmannia virus 1]AXY55038.1 22 kDa protein [Rehmannia virus 1]